MARLTVVEARKVLSNAGMTIRKTEYGEWRVTFKGVDAKKAERAAYYTDDLQDAVHTGVAMSVRK